MSAPIRSYIPARDFLEAHRLPVTGRCLISREAFYLGVREGRVPHVRLGRVFAVRSPFSSAIIRARSARSVYKP